MVIKMGVHAKATRDVHVRADKSAFRSEFMKATVDRIEGDLALIILRDGKNIQFNLPCQLLLGIKEGDIIDISVEKDEKATEEAKRSVAALIEKLKNKNR
jgi:hypothetical protein